MKTLSQLSFFLFTILLLSSCEKSYRFQIDSPKKATLESKVNISIKEENNNAYEKVLFFVNGKEVTYFIMGPEAWGVFEGVCGVLKYRW